MPAHESQPHIDDAGRATAPLLIIWCWDCGCIGIHRLAVEAVDGSCRYCGGEVHHTSARSWRLAKRQRNRIPGTRLRAMSRILARVFPVMPWDTMDMSKTRFRRTRGRILTQVFPEPPTASTDADGAAHPTRTAPGTWRSESEWWHGGSRGRECRE